ncbi:MAG: response regulator [Aquamicrobium sp.]|nr:response regulator [Aquamicrobium sp.]
MRESDTLAATALDRRQVLIVEDEPFIAFDLADAIESSGGTVVGPASTVREALQLLDKQTVEAAILDVNLPDGDVGPVIAALAAREIVFLVHTGAGLTPELQRLYPSLRVFSKPTPPPLLANIIAASLAGTGNASHP